jgi:hypothetical protein
LLRNAARTPGPAAIDWLCRLAGVAGAALDSGDFLDHLAFALDVVQDLPEGTDVLPYMENRRAACRAALETSGLAAARQRDVPVEIVLLSRTAAPFVDRAEARRQIAMIDLMSALTH